MRIIKRVHENPSFAQMLAYTNSMVESHQWTKQAHCREFFGDTIGQAVWATLGLPTQRKEPLSEGMRTRLRARIAMVRKKVVLFEVVED